MDAYRGGSFILIVYMKLCQINTVSQKPGTLLRKTEGISGGKPGLLGFPQRLVTHQVCSMGW